MYNIEVRYKTGDTFKTYDTKTTIEGNWNLETAKENLKRIKEHYKYYDNRNQFVSMAMEKRENELFEKLEQERFFTDKNNWNWSIMFLENDGSSKKYSVEWCGYFERLLGASIVGVMPDESDMEFEY